MYANPSVNKYKNNIDVFKKQCSVPNFKVPVTVIWLSEDVS